MTCRAHNRSACRAVDITHVEQIEDILRLCPHPQEMLIIQTCPFQTEHSLFTCIFILTIFLLLSDHQIAKFFRERPGIHAWHAIGEALSTTYTCILQKKCCSSARDVAWRPVDYRSSVSNASIHGKEKEVTNSGICTIWNPDSVPPRRGQDSHKCGSFSDTLQAHTHTRHAAASSGSLRTRRVSSPHASAHHQASLPQRSTATAFIALESFQLCSVKSCV